jgi:hypothetical protein
MCITASEEGRMALDELSVFTGEWELAVDLPGAHAVRGRVTFDLIGDLLVQRTTIPVPEAPDSCCVVLGRDADYVQHYFDSRGVARLYDMTFDGHTWTLQRTKADFTALDFCQRYVGSFSDDLATIDGEWQTSTNGTAWSRDFRLTHHRIGGGGLE